MRGVKMLVAVMLSFSLPACATMRSDVAAIAKSYKGKTAQDLNLPRTLWCADFVNLVRRQAGLKAVASRRAIDQARNAKRLAGPAPGALMITRRGRAGHHVDIVVEVLPSGVLRVVGGNVGRQVSERLVAPVGRFYLPI